MYAYLVAGATEEYNVCAYSYLLGNFPIQSGTHVGWTVVEAYLHGLIELETYVIKKSLTPTVTAFEVCTPSNLVRTLIDTDRLEVLHDNNWVDPDGPVFYIPELQELYYLRMYYKERGIAWRCLSELDQPQYRFFEMCRDHLQTILRTTG